MKNIIQAYSIVCLIVMSSCNNKPRNVAAAGDPAKTAVKKKDCSVCKNPSRSAMLMAVSQNEVVDSNASPKDMVFKGGNFTMGSNDCTDSNLCIQLK